MLNEFNYMPEKESPNALFLFFVLQYQKRFTNEERVEFWRTIKEDYCQFCGNNNPTCQCNNDE